MVYRKYSEFLPAYLGGNNIRRHSGVIESTDKEIYNRISLLGLWNVIRRPILVERVQEEPGTCTLHIHVNTESPIKSITTTGLSEDIDEQYQEQDLVTEVTLTTTATDTIPAVMPQFIVTVETYDDRIYKKGYLENDVVKNDVYDHDEFLDLVGGILGIPRRIYKDDDEYDTSMYEQMYPKYFTKQMYSDRHTGHITEDDYYYAKRLQRFVTEYGTKPLYPLIAELLYEWDDITTDSMIDRTTSIRDEIAEYAGTPVMQLVRGNERYINLDYSNMLEIVNGYALITRPILLSEPTLAYPRLDSTNTGYINNSYVEVSTWYAIEVPGAEEDTGALLKAPVKVYYQGETGEKLLGTYYSDDNGTVRVPINGLPLREGTIKIECVPEYEYYIKPEYTRTLTVQPSGTVDMNTDAWDWGRYNNPSAYIEPYTDQTLQALCVGRGALTFTGLIDMRLKEWTTYEIEVTFGYTGGNQHLGLGVATLKEDGTATFEASYANWLRPDAIIGEDTADNPHTMTIKITGNRAQYYLDDEDTGLSQSVKNGAMISLGCFNNSSLGNQGGLYIYSVTCRQPVSITDDCTTLDKWLVTDSGISAGINSQAGIPCVKPPTPRYQRVYWKSPLMRGTNSSIKFKVYITSNEIGIILGTMEKYGQDHMTSTKSWWSGLGSSDNWTDGPDNSQNRHGGTRMSYNTWHTIEFKLEDNLLQTYVDDVSVRDYTIPSDLSSNQYFNDYFFLGFSGARIWIRDIEYTSNTSISDNTLNSIRSAHMAQFE